MEVSRPAALRGLSIELQLVRVDNPIKKPGPVFTAATKVRGLRVKFFFFLLHYCCCGFTSRRGGGW